MTDLPVKLSDIQDKVRERIKAVLFDLIPPDKWDAIIKGEFERLTTRKRQKKRGYHDEYEDVPSPLEAMVSELVMERFKVEFQRWSKGVDLHTAGIVEFDDKFGELARECAKIHQRKLGEDIVKKSLEMMRQASISGDEVVCQGCQQIAPGGGQCGRCGYYNS